MEKDQETKEKNSLLGSRTDQLSCLLFSWKTFLNIIITVIKLTESQFFNPSSTNLLTKIHWAKIQYYLGLSLEIMSLQIGVKLIVSCNWWSFPPKWNQWIFPPNAQFFFHYKLGKKKKNLHFFFVTFFILPNCYRGLTTFCFVFFGMESSNCYGFGDIRPSFEILNYE